MTATWIDSLLQEQARRDKRLTAEGNTMSTMPEVYAWSIEYHAKGPTGGYICHRVFIANDGQHDIAYAEQRAADLHGTIVPLFTERLSDHVQTAA